MDNKRILIVEDDFDLSKIIKDFLTNENYNIKQAFKGNEALELVESFSPDLIILDIMLPEIDGIELCKQIRSNKNNIPIIIISAKSSDYDKVLALGVGADDYLTKPFSQIELVARVKSHLRRANDFNNNSTQKNNIKTFGRLSIDPQCYKVTIDNTELDFSPKEFQLLDFLTSNPSIVFSKEQLIDNIWGYTEFIDQNTIAVYIGRLREKLCKEGITNIKTVWGVGYKWEKDWYGLKHLLYL